MEKTRLRDRSGERGVAMVTAMAAALIISIMAIAVLNMTLRRFELSAFRTDRAVAGAEAEAGVRYAFAWLLVPANQLLVQNAKANERQRYFALSCNPAADVDLDAPGVQAPDRQVPALHMGGTLTPPAVDGVGGKHVVVRIIFGGGAGLPAGEAPLPPGAQYRVRSRTVFGTGEALR